MFISTASTTPRLRTSARILLTGIKQAVLVVILAAVALTPVAAGEYANALGACLTDHTNGKERKDLARWIFLGMTAHPDFQSISNATELDRENSYKMMGALVTRLLSENCLEQTQAAMQQEGSQAMAAAFGTLGQIAMQELMSNKNVSDALSAFEPYLDQAKIQSAISGQ